MKEISIWVRMTLNLLSELDRASLWYGLKFRIYSNTGIRGAKVPIFGPMWLFYTYLQGITP